jgi:hypothetical protein
MYEHFFSIKSDTGCYLARDTGYFDSAYRLSAALREESKDIKLASFLRYLYFKYIVYIYTF